MYIERYTNIYRYRYVHRYTHIYHVCVCTSRVRVNPFSCCLGADHDAPDAGPDGRRAAQAGRRRDEPREATRRDPSRAAQPRRPAQPPCSQINKYVFVIYVYICMYVYMCVCVYILYIYYYMYIHMH